MDLSDTKGVNMGITPEEAQHIGTMNRESENNLSSVKITRNSKGVTWEIKAKHEDAYKALSVAQDIDKQLRTQYGN